jgi:hypothetical protein
VVGHPPRRERRRRILWRRRGRPPDDDDDDNDDDDNNDVGVTLFAGNVYYSWQAIPLTNLHGHQFTLQPYGLNTPAAFSFLFNIIYAVCWVRRRYCLAGITKLGERVAKNTKLG